MPDNILQRLVTAAKNKVKASEGTAPKDTPVAVGPWKAANEKAFALGQKSADAVIPKQSDQVKADRGEAVHKAILAVRDTTKPAVRFMYNSVPGPVKDAVGASAGQQKAEPAPTPQETEQARMRAVVDQLKLAQEQQRIAELRQRLTSGN